MAKKRSPLQIRQEDLEYTWGCRKRDSRFTKDYDDCKKGILSEIDFCNKWCLDFVPDDLNKVNPLGDTDVPVRLLEKLTAEDTVTVVVTSESNLGQGNRRAHYHQSSTQVPRGGQRWIVEINPSHPLRLVIQGIKGLPWRSKDDRAKKNIEIRFAVYDRYQATDESFSSIASSLKKSVAVVVEAYFQVYRDIHGEAPPQKKRLRRLRGFDSKTHFQTCEVCLKAKGTEEWCRPARDFIDQDNTYLREKLRKPPRKAEFST